MNGAIARLRAEIRSDRDAFERRVAELASIPLHRDPHSPALRAQAAVALHHAYGSIESIMVRVARQLEGDLPSGSDWHRALLQSMALELEGVRPAVFSLRSVAALQHLLGFRHFFRHAYGAELDAGRLSLLGAELSAAAPGIVAELAELDAFLGRVAQAQ